MNTSLTKIAQAFGLVLILLSCTKEEVNQYKVDTVTLYNSASEKKNLKTDAQFLSILYTDLFGISITAQEMTILVNSYNSLGDKSLVIDMLTKSMLVSPEANIPTETEMRSNAESFINDAFKRFYVREASPQEVWFFTNLIGNDADLMPVDIYYSMFTANEYRYY
jgi:hypothetical protein